MTHQKPKRKSIKTETKTMAAVLFDSLKVMTSNDGLEVKVEISLDGSSRIEKALTLKGGFADPTKETLHPKKIERFIREEIEKILLPALTATVSAIFLESVANVYEEKPTDTRKKILSIHKESFDERNEIWNNGQEPITRNELFDLLVDAWQRLEKDAKREIENPSMTKLAEAIGKSTGHVSELISKHVKNFILDGEESNYTHFLNVVRHKKKVKERRQTLSVTDQKWLEEFDINSVLAEKSHRSVSFQTD